MSTNYARLTRALRYARTDHWQSIRRHEDMYLRGRIIVYWTSSDFWYTAGYAGGDFSIVRSDTQADAFQRADQLAALQTKVGVQ